MKTLLLNACLLIGGVSEAAETKSDTIIINVGANKKVVVYGETKADLKDLEKIDLNKALKEMNKNLEEMPLKTKKMVVKDYDGGYKLDSPRVDLTKWNRFTKKISINVHAAYLDLGYYQINPVGTPNTYIAETFGNYKESLNLGISFMHGKMYTLNNRLGFAFKKGLQYNFYRSEGSLPTPINISFTDTDSDGKIKWNYDPKSPEIQKVERAYTNSRNNAIQNTIIFKDGSTFISKTTPSIHTFGYISAELQPTFYLINKKGKNTISFSPGFFVSGKLHQVQKASYLYYNKDSPNVNTGGYWSTNSLQDFGNFNAGINLETSYKIFHFFWRHTLYSSLGRAVGSSGDKLNQYNLTPVDGNGRVKITTFGLRIGR